MSENKDAEMKKQEREQIVELGSDITKSQKGNIRNPAREASTPSPSSDRWKGT